MGKIEVNCPYCSAEQTISHVPGVQTLPCSCHRTFVVRIDDEGRLYIQREEDDYSTIPGFPYRTFIDQLPNMFHNSKWEILRDRSNKIDLIVRKNLGYYQPACFLGFTDGNRYHETTEIEAVLDEFFSIIGKNYNSFDMAILSAIGLLIIVSENPSCEKIFEGCRSLEKNAFFKKIYTSVGLYNPSRRTLYEDKPKGCSKEIKSILGSVIY